jgi:hypothetical protein
VKAPSRTFQALRIRGIGLALAFACGVAQAEYNSPALEPSAPPDGAAERTFLSLPSHPASGDPGTAPRDFSDFRPAPKRSPEELARALQEAERLRAMNQLERAKALDDELIRVRQMLNERSRQEADSLAAAQAAAEAASAPASGSSASLGTAPVGIPTVETAGVSRLLASVQEDEASRRAERARLDLLRESLARKQRRDPAYTRAAGGSNFHAAIEFNTALRGSSAPAADGPALGARNRLADRPERPANRQLFPVDTPDSMLLMHKFRAVDLAIDGKAAQLPEERRHQLRGSEPYDAAIKDGFSPLPAGGGAGGGIGGGGRF